MTDELYDLINVKNKKMTEFYPHIVKLISKKSESIVDIGCGEGHFLYYLLHIQKRVNPNYIAGLDVQKSRVEQAREKGLTVFCKDIFSVDICKLFDSKCDTIIAMQFLEHFDNWQEILEKLLAAANNEVIISVPFNEKKKPDVVCIHCKEKTPTTYHRSFGFKKETFQVYAKNYDINFKYWKKRHFVYKIIPVYRAKRLIVRFRKRK